MARTNARAMQKPLRPMSAFQWHIAPTCFLVVMSIHAAVIGFLLFCLAVVVYKRSTVEGGPSHRHTSKLMTFVGVVNPRLKEVAFSRTSASLSAFVIVIFSAILLIALAVLLHGQCTTTCGTVPLPLIDVTDGSTCVGFALTNDMPTFNGVEAAGSLISSNLLGKCSYLHAQRCAISSWEDLSTCATAFDAWVTAAQPTNFTSWASLAVRAF